MTVADTRNALRAATGHPPVRGRRLGLAVAAAAFGALGLSSCSSNAASPTTTSRPTQTTSSSTTVPPTSATTATTTAPAVTENLPITPAVTSQLIDAAAALASLAPDDYTGLRQNSAFYAYDAASHTYWAGAAVVPSPSSVRAQVSVQDDGGYILFSRPAGGSWTARDVGLAGVEGAKCPVTVPPAVLALWHWAPGTCRQAGS